VGRQPELKVLNKRIRVLRKQIPSWRARLSCLHFSDHCSNMGSHRIKNERADPLVLVIDGNEGVGKSRLVLHVQLLVRAEGGKMLIGYADQLRYDLELRCDNQVKYTVLCMAGYVLPSLFRSQW
jgi:hypothetical protein